MDPDTPAEELCECPRCLGPPTIYVQNHYQPVKGVFRSILPLTMLAVSVSMIIGGEKMTCKKNHFGCGSMCEPDGPVVDEDTVDTVEFEVPQDLLEEMRGKDDSDQES